MNFSFASLTYRPSAVASPTVVSDHAASELSPEAVVGLWQERSAIQETENTDLIRWHHDNGRPAVELRRACELCAAADLEMTYGVHVGPIIRPLLTNLEC